MQRAGAQLGGMPCVPTVASGPTHCTVAVLLQRCTTRPTHHIHLYCSADAWVQDTVTSTVEMAVDLQWLLEQHADWYPLRRLQVRLRHLLPAVQTCWHVFWR